MTLSHHVAPWVVVLGLLSIAQDAHAVRYTQRPLLWKRTAVSGYLGAGLPVGVFASGEIDGDGNEKAWPLDWTVEVEHFAGPTWSLGFSAAHTSYQDKTFDDLYTNLSTYSGFLRLVVPSNTVVRPYFRAGMGAVQVEFEKTGEYRVDADYSFSLQAGAGLLWLPQRWLGLNAQVLYYWGSTEDAYIAEADAIVGFDVQYFAFAGGVSLFFP